MREMRRNRLQPAPRRRGTLVSVAVSCPPGSLSGGLSLERSSTDVLTQADAELPDRSFSRSDKRVSRPYARLQDSCCTSNIEDNGDACDTTMEAPCIINGE